MSSTSADAVPKTHPASREMLPDDPLDLTGVEVSGDPALMLRMLVEEFARMGFDAEGVINLSRDPFFTALHGLWQAFGENELRRRVAEITSRCGVIRVTAREAAPPPQDLVQLECD